MLEAEITLAGGRLKVKASGQGQKELFKQLAAVQEVFGEQACGACKSEDIRFVVRHVEDNDFYELRCNKCGARLTFGQNKKGETLFPKRKIVDPNTGVESYDNEHRGWNRWSPPREAPAPPPSQPPQRSRREK